MDTIQISEQDQEMGSYRIITEDQYEKLSTLAQKIDALFALVIGNDEIELHDGIGLLMGEQSEQLELCIRGMKTITLVHNDSGIYNIQKE